MAGDRYPFSQTLVKLSYFRLAKSEHAPEIASSLAGLYQLRIVKMLVAKLVRSSSQNKSSEEGIATAVPHQTETNLTISKSK
jgi:hypothetical protein